jgi:carbon-monoxide dehydrogenase large subunit
MSVTCFHDSEPSFANSCVAAVVSVDPELGSVEVLRLVNVEDCGTMLNPLIVDGQITGGAAMAVGLALLERQALGDDGLPLAGGFADYLVPRATDVPAIEIEHITNPSRRNLAGVKGMAEGSHIGGSSAIVCAVLDALGPYGTSIDALPLSAPAVLRALQQPRALEFAPDSLG